MRIDLDDHWLLNATFRTNPQNQFQNELTLIFDAHRFDDPAASIVIIRDIHPVLGNQIERHLKTTNRIGWKKGTPKIGERREQVFNGTEWITTKELP